MSEQDDNAQWREIADCPTHEISTLGQVRRIRDGRILKTESYNSVLCVRLPYPDKSRRVFVSLLMLRTFVGDPPAGNYYAHHLDGKLRNVRLDNLEWRIVNR